jgi:signal transduction histidine kinase
MMFRRKILVVFALTVFLSVAAVAWLVLLMTRSAFEKTEDQRAAALVTQFRREFDRHGEDVVREVRAIATSEPVFRLATALNAGSADTAAYFEFAKTMTETHQLDFLELLDAHGTIISSAQWPAKFGYPEPSFDLSTWSEQPRAFLKLEELQDTTALGLFAVQADSAVDHAVYVIGGRRLDKSFLSAIDLPASTRILLYQTRGDHFSRDLLLDPSLGDRKTPAYPAEKLAGIVEAAEQYGREVTGTVSWTSDQADDEVFHAIPLRGIGKDHPLLAVLLVGNSRREYVELKRRIRASAMLVGGAGIVIAILLSSWVAARVTKPVEQLARAAHEVAQGNWATRVDVMSGDEFGQLADSFNRMTTELLTQKERLVQTERVAAWRELARRLAHELKNPLFPLQLTVENLVRARTLSPEEFDEVFRESSATLLAELSNLRAIIGRFSEFAKMPQPQLLPVRINEVLQAVATLFQAQMQTPGHAAIVCKLELDEGLKTIAADPPGGFEPCAQCHGRYAQWGDIDASKPRIREQGDDCNR